MLKSLTKVYNRSKDYLIAGLTATVLILGSTLYIHDLKYDKLEAQAGETQGKLNTSNSSVKTLETELQNLRLTLQANEKMERDKQAAIAAKLKQQDSKDKGLVELEKDLRTRGTTLNCTIPKDLTDAWNKL